MAGLFQAGIRDLQSYERQAEEVALQFSDTGLRTERPEPDVTLKNLSRAPDVRPKDLSRTFIVRIV
jgi:hypothetical protein